MAAPRQADTHLLRRPRRLITLDDDTCSAQPPGTRRRLPMLAAVWLVGGAAVLCVLVLAIKTWADDRAAAAAARVQAFRVQAAEADLAQVGALPLPACIYGTRRSAAICLACQWAPTRRPPARRCLQGTRADRRAAAVAAAHRSHRRHRVGRTLPPLALGSCPDLLELDSPLLGSPAAYRAATDGDASAAAEPDPHLRAGAADAAPAAPSGRAAQPAAAASRASSAPHAAADPFADLNPLPPASAARPMCGSV